jgi:hypothetical protein
VRLQDKVVVITGGGSGLGRESGLLFAEEGATIVVTDLIESRAEKVAAEINERGGTAIALRADVTVESDMEAAVKAAVDNFGRLDVMFANAGIPEVGFGTVAFEDTELADYRRVVDVVMTGVFLAAKHAVRQMKTQGGGNIVVTTSASAMHAYPGFPSYAGGKAGANGLVRAIALSVGAYGIRINALCPFHGMSANFAMPSDAEVLGKSYEEMEEWSPHTRAMPLRYDRPPRLRDNANVALFLASDDSAYMSGVCLPATDGGTGARVAIIFPGDLGGDVGVLPEGMHDS